MGQASSAGGSHIHSSKNSHTVDTGNNDQGHSVAPPIATTKDLKWYRFDDEDVSHFKPEHIPAHCFGGPPSANGQGIITPLSTPTLHNHSTQPLNTHPTSPLLTHPLNTPTLHNHTTYPPNLTHPLNHTLSILITTSTLTPSCHPSRMVKGCVKGDDPLGHAFIISPLSNPLCLSNYLPVSPPFSCLTIAAYLTISPCPTLFSSHLFSSHLFSSHLFSSHSLLYHPLLLSPSSPLTLFSLTLFSSHPLSYLTHSLLLSPSSPPLTHFSSHPLLLSPSPPLIKVPRIVWKRIALPMHSCCSSTRWVNTNDNDDVS